MPRPPMEIAGLIEGSLKCTCLVLNSAGYFKGGGIEGVGPLDSHDKIRMVR